MAFKFIDLFCGIGGFHAALSAIGGECVYAVDIDEAASKVYERNWGLNPLGDITEVANEDVVDVPDHDVLCAGFPCQPFSKSGFQRGMDETRGTLYWNILKIIETRKPALVLLENVRNLAGPRHRHEWEIIIRTLREAGYIVSENPSIFICCHRIEAESLMYANGSSLRLSALMDWKKCGIPLSSRLLNRVQWTVGTLKTGTLRWTYRSMTNRWSLVAN